MADQETASTEEKNYQRQLAAADRQARLKKIGENMSRTGAGLQTMGRGLESGGTGARKIGGATGALAGGAAGGIAGGISSGAAGGISDAMSGIDAGRQLGQMPGEAIMDAGQEIKQRGQNFQKAAQSEYQIKRQLIRDRDEARQFAQRFSKAKQSVEDLKKKYKNIQRASDVFKLITGALGSMGEIFASAPSFLIYAHGEWFYSSFINPNFKIAWWKKGLVILVDLVIFMIIVIILTLFGMLVYFYNNPWETLKTLGFGGSWEVLKIMIGGAQ